jgi:hypothetical protein
MSAWDDDAPASPSAGSRPQQGMSDSQLAELSENVSVALKKLKDACAVVGTGKDSAKLRAGIKSSREQLKAQLQRAAAECSGSKSMAPMQQQVPAFDAPIIPSIPNKISQKLLRSINEMQKDFDNVVLENQRKERLHALADDLTSKSSGGSGLEFANIDSSTTPLLTQQRVQQVMRIGGKEVVQHDVVAVEAVRAVLRL